MKLDLLWTKLLFLLIPLAINVTAVENFKDSGQPESLNGSWFTNWRRTRTTLDLEQEKTSFVSTTPLIHPLLSKQGHAYQQSKSLVNKPLKSYALESTPTPVQITAALNIEPMVATQPRILKLRTSNEKERDTIDTDVKTTRNNPKPLSTIEITERKILSSTIPDVASIKPSHNKLQQLSDLVSVNRSINYDQVKPIGATSSSSPQFVPYGLSTSLSKPMLLISQLYGYSCATSKEYYKFGDSCDQFVECKEYVASLYKCQPGHQFNRTADYGEDPCAPSSIIRCERSVQLQMESPAFSALLISNHLTDFVCPTRNGYYRLGTDCEKFIKCEQSVPSSYQCMSGLQFNHYASWGDDPCASSSVMRCKTIKVQPRPETNFSAVWISSNVSYICPSNNGYYSSENSCDKFYKCEKSVPSLYKCFPGLQFNRYAAWEHDPCDTESVVRCHAFVVQPPPPPKVSAAMISTLPSYTCPFSNGYYIFRLENECDKFIKCEQFAASLYKCLSGLEFNAKAGPNEDPCAVPAVARCKREVIIPPKSALLIDPNLEDYRCTEANGYFGIDNNCERFVECKMFVPSLFMCPNGLLFNKQAAWGMDPCSSLVHCEIKSTLPPTEQPPQKKSYTIMLMQVPGYFCSVNNGYFSAKDKCDHFIMCKKNVASLNICNFGLHFKRNASWEADPCTDPTTAQCQLSGPPIPVEPDTAVRHCPRWRGYFPLDNTECSKYIRCEYGRAIIMPCPPGLVFNAELEACDWPVNVPSCNPDVFHGFKCPAPEVTENGMPSEKIFKFRYGQSCRKYIACQAGRPRLLTCDFGLSFSPESQRCIQRDLVDCKD